MLGRIALVVSILSLTLKKCDEFNKFSDCPTGPALQNQPTLPTRTVPAPNQASVPGIHSTQPSSKAVSQHTVNQAGHYFRATVPRFAGCLKGRPFVEAARGGSLGVLGGKLTDLVS